MTYDGMHIKHLLERKGYSLSSVAQDLRVSPPLISHVIYGRAVSRRVVAHIERLLGMESGKLKIRRATNRYRAA